METIIVLKRVRYISEFSGVLSPDELRQVAADSARNNKREQITGLLISAENLFFQLLEGPPEAVDECYRRIKEDPRHTNVLFLGMEVGDLDRLCPDWDMKGVDLNDESRERFALLRGVMRSIHVQQMAADRLRLGLEEAVWTELMRVGEEP